MPRGPQRTILFVGAGRHQRRALRRVRELGVRIVAVDANPQALGLQLADVAETVDFRDVDAVERTARRHAVDGVFTVSSDRAVPVVAEVASRLGLPSIGLPTAIRMTDKLAMRRALAQAGVLQPRFAAVRTLAGARAALDEIGLPAVLKPADAAGQRGLALIREPSELEAHLDEAVERATTGEAIIERFHEGREVNTLLVAREGEPFLLTASDRLRPQGRGFGVALAHAYPADLDEATREELERTAIATVRALGLRDGVAYPQLLVCGDGVRVVEVAARIPGGQMSEVVRHAIGVDLIEVALHQALGDPVPDELFRPRFQQPMAIVFLTASPGALRPGRVVQLGALEPLLELPGIVEAESYMALGEAVRPVQVDGDRRGYVIALGESREQALARAEEAARRFPVTIEPESE
ncbi:MAG: ATP-binding protein [Gaiellaceae bacterium]